MDSIRWRAEGRDGSAQLWACWHGPGVGLPPGTWGHRTMHQCSLSVGLSRWWESSSRFLTQARGQPACFLPTLWPPRQRSWAWKPWDWHLSSLLLCLLVFPEGPPPSKMSEYVSQGSQQWIKPQPLHHWPSEGCVDQSTWSSAEDIMNWMKKQQVSENRILTEFLGFSPFKLETGFSKQTPG